MEIILTMVGVLVSVLPLLLMLGVVLVVFRFAFRRARAAKKAWQDLAGVYGFEGEFPRENCWRMNPGSMGGMSYRGGLTFAADGKGMYMAMSPFGFGRKPLFFPWADVIATDGRDFIFRAKVFAFRREPGVLVKVSVGLGNKILRAGGQIGVAN